LSDADPVVTNNLKSRIAAALALSVGAGLIVAYQQLVRHGLGLDFLWIWRATKIVLNGGDPYLLIQPVGDADPRIHLGPRASTRRQATARRSFTKTVTITR
jgi:hypothetical protein